MDVLVTGATGFIGSALVRRLVEEGTAVRIFRRATSRLDLLGAAARRVEHVTGDLLDPRSLLAALEGVEEVYHAAARVGLEARRDRAELFRVNAEGTAHVVNAAQAAGVRRLVYTSSMAALGRPEGFDGVLDETTTWHPSRNNSAYAASKHAAEREVQRAVAEGLDAVIVNPALVFGVGRAGENTRRIVDRVRTGRLPGIPAGGTCVVDVEDVAAGHLRAMRYGQMGERYLLGSENLSWRAILQTLADAFGTDLPGRPIPPRLAQALGAASEALAFVTRTRPLLTRASARMTARTYRYSNRRAVEELGCTFRPFRETAQRIARALSA